MPDIHISVRGGLAEAEGVPQLICGNSDYRAVFELDSPWDAYEVRCARFVWRDLLSRKLCCADVLFEGNTAEIPPVYNTDLMLAGVYAGNELTSTPVRIVCRGCATDSEPVHRDPDADIYRQLLGYLAEGDTIVMQPYETMLIMADGGTVPQLSVPECISEPVSVT